MLLSRACRGENAPVGCKAEKPGEKSSLLGSLRAPLPPPFAITSPFAVLLELLHQRIFPMLENLFRALLETYSLTKLLCVVAIYSLSYLKA